MKKIAALTPGKNIPSSRFRIHQYTEDLYQQGISVKEYNALLYDNKIPGFLGRVKQRYIFPISASYEFVKLFTRLPQALMTHTCDATWLNRTFYNAVNLEVLLKKPLIFDIDDAIWINSGKHVGIIAEKSSLVIAGNDYIANWANTYNKNVTIVPTAVDTDIYKAGNSKSMTFNIGWSGTADNLKYVYDIEDALTQFLDVHKDVKLIILSDNAPVFSKISSEKVEWVKWSAANEVETIQRFHVGLMPLQDTEWAKGKCSFKMLQYMSTGIPVIVSPVGMNLSVFKKGEIGYLAKNASEWREGLEALYKNRSLSEKLGENGRTVIVEHYSKNRVAKQLSDIFNKVV